MEATDMLTRILSELLIENSTMKALLKNATPKIDEILRAAKADPVRQRKALELAARVKAALTEEAALEQLMEKIAGTSAIRNLA